MKQLDAQPRNRVLTFLLLVFVAGAAASSSPLPTCFLQSSTNGNVLPRSALPQQYRRQHGSRSLAAALFNNNKRQMKDSLRPSPPPSPPSSSALNEWAAEVSLASLKEKFMHQPFQRIIPLVTLISFVGYVFISPYAPGVPNIFDPAVLKQVGGLTLTYFCVLPTLLPGLAPKFSPVMEGVFNLLLAYAALLSGFLVDGRKAGSSSSSVNFFLPFAAAGLALTNTAFLPYLVLRPLHKTDEACIRKEEVPEVELQLGESKKLLAVYGLAGLYSVWWGFFGRAEFGGLSERWTSLVELASTDRLMFAFCVEAALFCVFQGWLVNDDLRRRTRGREGEGWGLGEVIVPWVAKVVPFVGLFVYMMWRPPLLEEGEEEVGSGNR